jgi:2-C-methyl-D-erythritol 4-phosphate cytidylyltransferase
MTRVAGILLAAGASTRMGTDKLWADLGGKPLIAWSLQTLASCRSVNSLIVAVSAAAHDRMACLMEELGIQGQIVVGGLRRQDSVRAALNATDAEWVVVHDGARPLLTSTLIEDGLAAAAATGAAIAAVPSVDTIKQVSDGSVVATLDRANLWTVQTPQVFRTSLLRAAHESIEIDVTDDAALVEALGATVRVYMGAYENVKVTLPSDLALANSLLTERG